MKTSNKLKIAVLACAVSTILGSAVYAPQAIAESSSDHKHTRAGYAFHKHTRAGYALLEGEILPTGMRITPTAATGAVFQALNPDLPGNPDYLADHATAATMSPDGNTLLILTSGYNRNNDADGQRIAEESNEYVFVYDVSAGTPNKTQVIQVPNTFNGIAWNPNDEEFYVSGGVDDNVHVYIKHGGIWIEDGAIALGHSAGEGLRVRPMAADLTVNAGGTHLLVSNFENDSVSLVDIATRSKVAELDLRPGKLDPAMSGQPGGSYPFSVIFKGDDKAYVSSMRDRELVVLNVSGNTLSVAGRVKTQGQPSKMIMNRDQSRLYVASDNSDTIVVLDTAQDRVLEDIHTTAPKAVFPDAKSFKGANPNSLALSPDEGTLFVTNGGSNSVAVIQLGHAVVEHDDDDGEDDEHDGKKSRVIGLIPTGWYPNSVNLSQDGKMLYVVNGKSNAGPNPQGCRDTLSTASGSLNTCRGANQYVWQLEKAGFLSMPMPNAGELAKLTWQVAKNNNFPSVQDHEKWEATMAFLRSRIDHVIYVVKENRTYDQVLGALEVGNGDPDLAILAPYSPNHIRMARQFVTLDNFYDSGETSNTGWNWTTAARTTDFTEKTSPVNYAGRGLSYDWEGNNRNINVGFATLEERKAANAYTPDDPDLLAGAADVAAPDGPEGEAGAGYLWDTALRAGLRVRNYGFYGDLSRYFLPHSDPNFIALSRYPHAEGVQQFYPTKQSLMDITDPYFRGYDMKYADYWRFKEWEREFDAYAAKGELPNLSLVRVPHDHFGSYSAAMDGVNTVETQMADNDYAIGLIVEKVANSPFKNNTLVFIVEDDAQNGGDHVDPHRSIAYVVGPYVKQGGEVISQHYTTVSMLRTIEEVLGIEPMGINDGFAAPMVDVFDRKQSDWDYRAAVPEILYSTELPLPAPDATLVAKANTDCDKRPKRSAAYWAKSMQGQDFTVEDNLDTPRFNQALWQGLKDDSAPYPGIRHGRDMREDRAELLRQYQAKLQEQCKLTLSTR